MLAEGAHLRVPLGKALCLCDALVLNRSEDFYKCLWTTTGALSELPLMSRWAE